MTRPVLTKDQLWPPCARCGSDGFPADYRTTRDDQEYLCYDCKPAWIREAVGHLPHKLTEILQRHIDSRDEIMGFRDDPTCFSYRGYGPVV